MIFHPYRENRNIVVELVQKPLNPLVSVSAVMTLIDFTLSNARRFYSSMGNPSDTEGLTVTDLKKLKLSE